MRSNSQDDISNTQQPIKSLFDDRVFITLFLSGLVLSVISAAAIIYASSLTFCLQAECFNNALSVFKFPIGIATAGITLSGLYALAHRSQQTAIQIRKTEEQIAKADAALQETKSNNTYSNYLRHRDDCIAGFNSIAMKLRCEIRDPEKLYSLIFPENSPFSFSHRSSMGADGYFINNTLSKYQAMTNYLEEASDLSNTPIHAQLVQSKLNELLSELQFFVKNSGFKTIKDKHFFRDIENTALTIESFILRLQSLSHIEETINHQKLSDNLGAKKRLSEIARWITDTDYSPFDLDGDGMPRG